MSRYIDADHLKKSAEALQDCYNGYSDTYDKACIIGLIDEEPTADVVEVVRCKDCANAMYTENGDIFCDGIRDANWFCADGEKVSE